MRERGLSDDWNAALHGRERSETASTSPRSVDPDDVQTRRGEVLYITLLMGRAAFRQDLQKGIPDLRLR